jgi:hypothetical protein
MQSIIKVCKKHGKLAIKDIYLRKNNKNVCAICSRENSRIYYKVNAAECIKKKTAYKKTLRKLKPHIRKVEHKKYFLRTKEDLRDTYIKRLLRKGSILKTIEIPKDLIELKRYTLLLARKIKECNN